MKSILRMDEIFAERDALDKDEILPSVGLRYRTFGSVHYNLKQKPEGFLSSIRSESGFHPRSGFHPSKTDFTRQRRIS